MKFVKRTDCKSVEELFLNNMGVRDLDGINAWFKRYIVDGYDIKGIDEIVSMISSSDRNTPVIISGDYDVDGVTASSIMYLTLTWLGFTDVKIFIPNRFKDGFGINEKIFELSDHGIIFTVDNGIAQGKVIEEAKMRGYTVILTDHHEPDFDQDGQPIIPAADVVIDPNAIPDSVDFTGYCGAGLAFKIARRLIKDDPGKRQILLSLACLGTICDVVPLREENYVIVRYGLKCLMQRNTTTSGVFALVQTFNLADTISAHDCGFLIGPAINAVSRMLGDATMAVDLLKFDGPFEEARKMATKLIDLNEKRKTDTKTAYNDLKNIIETEKLYEQVPIIAYIPKVSEGLTGILAGRICDEYKVPAIILSDTEEPDVIKGSARSLDGYHIKNHLDMVAPLLLNYGGHENAAGLSMKRSDESGFRDALTSLNDFIRVSSQDVTEYDLELTPDMISGALDDMDRFEPYGEGNEAPLVKISGFKPTPDRYGKYLQRCGADLSTVRIESKYATAIGFRMSDSFTDVDEKSVLNLYGSLSWNCFNGKKKAQIEFTGIEIS